MSILALSRTRVGDFELRKLPDRSSKKDAAIIRVRAKVAANSIELRANEGQRLNFLVLQNIQGFEDGSNSSTPFLLVTKAKNSSRENSSDKGLEASVILYTYQPRYCGSINVRAATTYGWMQTLEPPQPVGEPHCSVRDTYDSFDFFFSMLDFKRTRSAQYVRYGIGLVKYSFHSFTWFKKLENLRTW